MKITFIDAFFIKYASRLPKKELFDKNWNKIKNFVFAGSTVRNLNKTLQISNFPITTFVTPEKFQSIN